MLSRVAERIYWLARYLERAEDTSRLVNVNCQVVLDLPIGVEMGWRSLLEITATEKAFFSRYQNITERNVIKFLLADLDNPGSIVRSIASARENIRITRDILPFELWEQVNELYLFAKDRAGTSISRRERYDFLHHIGCRCDQISGLIEGTMSRDEAYHFIRLGRQIERADMTTRILDVVASILMAREKSAHSFEPLLWTAVLDSIRGLSMYRRHQSAQVVAHDTTLFVLTDKKFPCAVACCLRGILTALAKLPNHDGPVIVADGILKKLKRDGSHAKSYRNNLHGFIDQLQRDFIRLDKTIQDTWFEFAVPE